MANVAVPSVDVGPNLTMPEISKSWGLRPWTPIVSPTS